MDKMYFRYANVVRLVCLDDRDFSESIMIDLDKPERSILSTFNAQNEYEGNFIRSFINILRESSTGFKLIEDDKLIRVTDEMFKEVLPMEVKRKIFDN